MEMKLHLNQGKVEHYDMIIEGVGTHPNSKIYRKFKYQT